MNFWEKDMPKGGRQTNEQDILGKFEGYGSKSEAQLMSELTSLASRMKSEGTFDVAFLENLYATASPFLSEVSRGRMKAIIDMLKSDYGKD